MAQDVEQPVDRRGFLRKLAGRGAVAMAGAAGASALFGGTAGAADDDTILIGSAHDANNTGTTTTTLSGSQFKVTDGNASRSITASHTAGNAIAVEAAADSGAGLRIVPDGGSIVMPPATNTWLTGSMRVDDFGDIWYCYAGGTGPFSGWYPLSLIPAFIPLLNPVRIYDSRIGQAPLTVQKGTLAPNVERIIDSTVGGAVPLTALAVLLNFTVTGTVAGGFMAVRPNGVPYAGTSSINWVAAGQTIANNATTGTDIDGLFKVRGGGSAAHFVIDALGFYTLTA